MRILKWVGSISAVLIIVLFAGVYLYLRSTLPDYNGEITISGLKDKVEIIRDAYGMPHIYAQTDEDAFFALGYCMAQDRLFQMDMVKTRRQGKIGGDPRPGPRAGRPSFQNHYRRKIN